MRNRRAVQLSGLFDSRMVDDTGLEPVTPGMAHGVTAGWASAGAAQDSESDRVNRATPIGKVR